MQNRCEHESVNKAIFFDELREIERSAAIVVPKILRLQPKIRSVVDFDCGLGTWLTMFQRHGIADIKGYSEGPLRAMLQIPHQNVSFVDLMSPIEVSRKFDLAISLGLVQRLPDSRAVPFIENICLASDLVMFSTAVPGQGGRKEVKENWLGHWERLFEAQGYVCEDVFRPMFWNDSRVDWRYAQNTAFFVRKVRADLRDNFAAVTRVPTELRNILHPRSLQNFVPSQSGDQGDV